MNEFFIKYNKLDDAAKLDALRFIDLLYINKTKSSFVLSEYKKKILNVTIWTEDDFSEK